MTPALPPLRLSVLDLSPVASGSSSTDALRNTLDLARLADTLGYTRYWLSEHHNTTALASAVPEVLIGHVAGATRRIRVGSGGVMLPNHSPLKVAETFRTLEALHPGRIDLGIGRAAGTDPMTALALRRYRDGGGKADDFPAQMEELLAFFSGEFPQGHRYGRIIAIPHGVETPDLWLLGSSDFSARMAAALGLGFAFAHHINPDPAVASLRLYREQFQPSAYLTEPRSLIAVSVVCGETDELADELARSGDLARLRFHRGQFGPLPSVAEATQYPYTPEEREEVRTSRAAGLFWGAPATLRDRLFTFAGETGVGEVMAMTMIHDHTLRRRSYELLAEAFALTPA
jgi:luciferase family oxidoreductase group 1